MPIINGHPFGIGTRCCHVIEPKNIIGLLVSCWLINVSNHPIPDIAFTVFAPQVTDKEEKELQVENRVVTLPWNCYLKLCKCIKLYRVQIKYVLVATLFRQK
jgi:hypothetical protein